LDGIDSTGFLLVGGTAVNSQLLDNLDSNQFLRSDANDTLAGNVAVTGDMTFNPSGNMPFIVPATKTDVVTNLNADKLDGNDASDFAAASHDLDSHSDVATSGETESDYLRYNGSNWANYPLASVKGELNYWSADTYGLTYTDGNIGIGGVSGASYDLKVYGTSNFVGNVIPDASILRGTDVSNQLISGGTATNVGANIALFGSTHATLANIVRFRASGTETMRIDATGKVGINTAPDAKFHVNSAGANKVALFQSTDPYALIYFQDNTTTNGSSSAIGTIGNVVGIWSEASQRVWITSGGVGIGVGDPDASIEINQTAKISASGASDCTLHFWDNDDTDAFYFEFDTSDDEFSLWCKTAEASNVEFIRVKNGASPYMGIGGAGNASYVLQITGDLNVVGSIYDDGSQLANTFEGLTDTDIDDTTALAENHVVYYTGSEWLNIHMDTFFSSYAKIGDNETIVGTWTFDEVITGTISTAQNAQLLDSIDSLSFLRSDATDIFTGTSLTFNDSKYLNFGTGNDFKMYWDGSDMYMEMEGSGDLIFKDQENDMDIVFDMEGALSGTIECLDIKSTSDFRLKENIKEFDIPRGETDYLWSLLRQFDWIHSGLHDIGLIAQAVERFAPTIAEYVVFTSPRGERHKKISYDKLNLIMLYDLSSRITRRVSCKG